MYSFELMEKEEIIKIIDEFLIKQNDKQRIISAILTDKRLLFLDYVNNTDYMETLRTARGMDYLRNKEVIYIINLDDIVSVYEDEYFVIKLKDNITFEFEDKELFELLNK